MTKITKSANHFNTSSNSGVAKDTKQIAKKTPKCAKLPPAAVVVAMKKKLLMTQEQEAAIAETISFVIRSKVCAKNARKSAPPPPPQDVPKPKRAPKSPKGSELVVKEPTAKKTALPAKSNKAAKKEVNTSHSTCGPKSGNVKKAIAEDRKAIKRASQAVSPSARASKLGNKGEIEDNKAETKADAKQATSSKLKPVCDQEKQDDNESPELADKSSTRKDKRDKEVERESDRAEDKAAHKTIKEKKDAEKLAKERSVDDVDKFGRGAKKAKDVKVMKVAKVKCNKEKPSSKAKLVKQIAKEKKPIAVKVSARKLNKSRPSVKKKKVVRNEGLIKKAVSKDANINTKDEKRGNQKLKVKEEQLDDVIASILKSSSKTEAEKPKPDDKDAKQAAKPKTPTKKAPKTVPKLSPAVLAKKLKAKLKAAPPTNVIAKNKNPKAKLVAKPIQQVKSRKLLSIWNGPKRYRVACLNAMAKVHCLYDNEFRSNFDQLDPSVRRESADAKEEKKAVRVDDAKRTRSLKHERQASASPQPTRTLRSVPGLRAVGKMWDMHDTTSSSEEDYPATATTLGADRARKAAKSSTRAADEKHPGAAGKSAASKSKKPAVKRRKREEVIMDLKDMVVRKRMASLNASAILAASYSAEKRTRHRNGSETETSDTENSDTSDEHPESGEMGPLKKAEDIKQEEAVDCKLVEVRSAAVPGKKVAVIVNQDTDVTFTGVYVNSTTRSTHHEGYCHIGGMQYRISATSHTQTAATAVATETILQSTTTTTHENEAPDAAPVKSYTPLDALSNMQPPANAAGALPTHQHHHHHHHMQPPAPTLAPTAQQHHHHPHGAHVHPIADVGPLARRHGCAVSAFSSPQGHHGPQPDHGYVQGYYQPAGPLISVHGHSQALPPPTLSSKSVPLSDASPVSTSPLQQPPPPNSAGDSSDSEVIITSVTTAKEALAAQQQPPPLAYRLNHHYPPPSPHGAYSAYGPYPPQYYGAPPPPPAGPAAYPHHDMCYTAYPPHKYMFRRYLAPPAPPYYPAGSADLYGQPPSTNQQAMSVSSATSGSYQSSSTGPPPPTLLEPYPGPPPTLIETYSPSPAHYYQGYGPAPPCYTHSPPARSLNYINATYQPCPCPMQSCPKNVHTGPLTGDSKRSNIAIAKESMPLPPVALALPLEPASATGPPSPARGSAGMPPPPSPAGATYQPPPPPPKQETPEPAATDATAACQQVEKRRKARVGKAMVRNTIAQNQQSTMLLMCQTPAAAAKHAATMLENVKREVESPKEETRVPDAAKALIRGPTITLAPAIPAKIEGDADAVLVAEHENNIKCEKPEIPECLEKHDGGVMETQPAPEPDALARSLLLTPTSSPPYATAVAVAPPPPESPPVNDELLLPCQKTVAENVKVKNMKRKCSVIKDAAQLEVPSPAAKKPKVDKPNGSYKDLIKKTQNVVKINNGKRKLITETRTANGVLIRIKKSNNHNNSNSSSSKRRLCVAAVAGSKEEHGRRSKPSKPLTDSNVPLSIKANSAKSAKAIIDPELIENKEPSCNKNSLRKQQQPAEKAKKLIVANGEKTGKLSNLDRTIESVVHNLRTAKVPPESGAGGASRTEKVEKVEKVASIQCRRISNGERGTGAKRIASKVSRAKRAAEKGDRLAARRGNKAKEATAQPISHVPRRLPQLRWSNGWRWHGESFDGKIFINSDEATVLRKCYPAMVHEEGDIIEPRDCVLLKAGQRKNELPFVAKIAALWENPDDGEMMMSLLWYYRPEHTEQDRRPVDQPDEVFASRHKDSNSVACIEDKCYVLTYNEYCRYRKDLRRLEACIEDTGPCIPQPDLYPRLHRQPPSTLGTSADLVFFCRKVYDFRQKRIIKNPS